MSAPLRFNSFRQNFYTTEKLNKAIEEVLECEKDKGNKKVLQGGKSYLFRVACERLIFDYWNDKSGR